MRSERRRTYPGEIESQNSGDPQVDRCLDELGARLRRESVRLATRYPANRPQIAASPAPRRSFGNAAWVTALAAAAVVAIAVSPWLRDSKQLRQQTDRAVASAAGPKMGQAPDIHDLEPVPFSEPVKMGQAPDVHAPEPVSFSPLMASHTPVIVTEVESPVFLLDVSDPELEALLDLWEKERPEKTRLSI
jgi:hypothetical protein